MAHLFSDLRRGSRHERGYGSAWDKTRVRIMMRDGGICQPCLKLGSVHPGTEVDHRTPKAQGGTDDDDNLQTICKDAHRAKTNGKKHDVSNGDIHKAGKIKRLSETEQEFRRKLLEPEEREKPKATKWAKRKFSSRRMRRKDQDHEQQTD